MLKKYLKFSLFSIIGFVLLLNLHIQNCLADAKSSALGGLDDANAKPRLSTTNVPDIIGKVIGVVLAFIGIIFFILMIYAGFLWMTARGNEQDVQKAKYTILQASIGLIIVLAAYAITAFLGGGLEGIF